MNTPLHVLAILLCAGTLPAFQDEPIIDLTRPAAQTSPVLFPGLSAGSSSGLRLGPGVHSIPVQIRLLHARLDAESRRLLVVVSLRNSGPQTIHVPVSRDSGVHRDGHRDRRLLVLNLRLQPENNAGMSQVAGVTFGSDTVADSFHKLLPGHGIRFRLALPFPAASGLPARNNSTPATLYAGCYEQLTGDDDYIITTQSAIVTSPAVPVDR